MSVVRGYAEVAWDLRLWGESGEGSIDLMREAAALLAGVTAVLPDCPTCGGVGWIAYTPGAGQMHDDEQDCPDCVDGKVTVAQLVATWQAVHAGIPFGSHNTVEGAITYLRSVRPPSPKEGTAAPMIIVRCRVCQSTENVFRSNENHWYETHHCSPSPKEGT